MNVGEKMELIISTPSSRSNPLAVKSIKISAFDGEMMILPGHEEMIVMLKKGGHATAILHSGEEGGETSPQQSIFLFPSGGIASVEGNRCVLATTTVVVEV